MHPAMRFEQRSLTSEAEQRAATVAAQIERMRPATYDHSRRVADLAVRVARQARLPAPMVNDIYWGALVHDIGELSVRRSLFDKPATLDERERIQVSAHTIVGARWLASMPGLAPLVPFARWHHERFDGLGYPDGCTGDKVPLAVALVGVCDAWDALTEDRPYRKALTPAEAAAEMRSYAGRQWSRALVEWTLECAGAPAPAEPQ
jgi:HD-GYP domain-containing protein (c-di-GMP phosphodiesterase class II)